MKRYKAGNKAAKSNKSRGDESNLTPILLAIIVVLVGFILGGFTVNDLKNML